MRTEESEGGERRDKGIDDRNEGGRGREGKEDSGIENFKQLNIQ